MNIQRRSLYDLEWQILRVNLDFSSAASTAASLAICTKYVLEKGSTPTALYKVINLYAATVMGFNGQIRRFCNDKARVKDLQYRADVVTSHRKQLSDIYKDCHMGDADFAINNEKRKSDIAQADLDDLNKVHRSLTKRLEASKRRPHNSDRPELEEYIEMLRAELERRSNLA